MKRGKAKRVMLPSSTFSLFQIHYGDLIPDKTSKFATEALERFFPSRYLDGKSLTTSTVSTASGKDLEQSLLEKWATLKAKSASDCVRIFLTCTRKWQFFGAKLFEVQVCIHIPQGLDFDFGFGGGKGAGFESLMQTFQAFHLPRGCWALREEILES